MITPHQLTPREREAIAHHQAGRTPAQIAPLMGVSYARARQLLIDAGVTPHRTLAPAGTGQWKPQMDRVAYRRPRAERRDRVRAELTVDPTLSTHVLAQRIGAHPETVRKDRQALRLQRGIASGRP